MTPKRGAARDNAWAGALAAAHLGIALAVLRWGHPHEDAYILFKYAQNVAGGHGIVWFAGGPHAEGATDFLWMLAIAGGTRLGIDVAVAAAVLSAASSFVCARLFLSLAPAEGGAAPTSRPRFGSAAVLPLLLVAPPAIAAYVGFSSMLFSTAALGLLWLYLSPDRRSPLLVAPLGLFVALVRPDGVILAAGFVVLAAWRARREGTLARVAVVSSITAAVGAAYFAWRARYFGEWLPLPLIVKSHVGSAQTGVEASLDWAASTLAPYLALLVAGALLLGRPRERGTTRRIAVALIPYAIHTASFAASTPSQNIANRFQSPAALALLFAAAWLASRRPSTSTPRRAAHVALFAAALTPQIPVTVDTFEGAFEQQYMNRFAHEIWQRVPKETRLATTEAGRLPFWSRGATLDLVGLNTRETAKRPPTVALLDGWAPDLVLLHPAGILDEDAVERDAGEEGRRDVFAVRGPVLRYVRPWALALVAPASSAGSSDPPPYAERPTDHVRAAPAATLAWLDQRLDRYDVYAARFKARFVRLHLYAVLRTSPAARELARALDDAHRPGETRSYVDLVRVSARPAR